jgi:uncharacterized protein (TIGR02147 family)
MKDKKLNIYSFLDYRTYLKEYYIRSKNSGTDFSYRSFSKLVGVKAPNFLQWLILGKRNLADETIPKVAMALGLDGKEAEYFRTLVLFNQAKTLKSKTACFEKIIGHHSSPVTQTLTRAQYSHYNRWYNEAVRELLKYVEFNPSEKYAFRRLSKMLCPAITESQARKAIRQLLELGLVVKDKDGILRQADVFITTGDEVRSFFVQKFHENMIALAGESMDRFPSQFRDISSVTLSISDECFALVKKEVQQMRKRVMELAHADKQPGSVYQLNFQFFPLVPKKGNRIRQTRR